MVRAGSPHRGRRCPAGASRHGDSKWPRVRSQLGPRTRRAVPALGLLVLGRTVELVATTAALFSRDRPGHPGRARPEATTRARVRLLVIPGSSELFRRSDSDRPRGPAASPLRREGVVPCALMDHARSVAVGAEHARCGDRSRDL